MPLRFLVTSLFFAVIAFGSAAPSYALRSSGGRAQPLPGTPGTVFHSGVLAVSLVSVRAATCLPAPHALPPYRTAPNQEFLSTYWTLRNLSDRLFRLPKPNDPGFRLISGHRLLPGTYRSYPGYSYLVPAHGWVGISWSFVIPRGATQAEFTYLPPGPRAALWLVHLPAEPATGPCQ